MRYTTDKDLNNYIKELEKEGWTVSYGKHLKLRSPNGSLVTCSISPSCPHVYKQVRGDVRKALRREKENTPSGVKL